MQVGKVYLKLFFLTISAQTQMDQMRYGWNFTIWMISVILYGYEEARISFAAFAWTVWIFACVWAAYIFHCVPCYLVRNTQSSCIRTCILTSPLTSLHQPHYTLNTHSWALKQHINTEKPCSLELLPSLAATAPEVKRVNLQSVWRN